MPCHSYSFEYANQLKKKLQITKTNFLVFTMTHIRLLVFFGEIMRRKLQPRQVLFLHFYFRLLRSSLLWLLLLTPQPLMLLLFVDCLSLLLIPILPKKYVKICRTNTSDAVISAIMSVYAGVSLRVLRNELHSFSVDFPFFNGLCTSFLEIIPCRRWIG